MKDVIRYLAPVTVCTMLALPQIAAAAQTAPAIPPAITTPGKVESRLGTLDFKDGAPDKATLEKAYDQIDSRTHTMHSSTQCRVSAWSLHAEAFSTLV